MRLSTKEEIEAPIAYVHAQLSDFEALERAAQRRGADVHRTDALRRSGVGMAWTVDFLYRGKPRKLAIRLDRQEVPGHLGFSGTGSNVAGTLTIELAEMAPRRTRVTVVMEVKPRTLMARLFFQSLKLAKRRVQNRFRARVAAAATEIEQKFTRSQRP